MSDLIRREDAVSRISDLLMIELQGKRLPTWNEVYNAINGIPSAEPERKNGEWKSDESGNVYWIYSICGFASEAFGADILYHFCPRCGADMRGNNEKA